jgi:hypothetical protein
LLEQTYSLSLVFSIDSTDCWIWGLMVEPMAVVHSIDQALSPEPQEGRDLYLAAPMAGFCSLSVQLVQMTLPLEKRYIPVGRTVLKGEASVRVVRTA